MIAAKNIPFSPATRPSPPDRATADDETLQALEHMLANPDGRLSREDGSPDRLDRCALVREMLERMDTLGPAGQGDVMGRVISLLITEGEASVMGEGNRRTFCEQLDHLRHEAGRPWPDAASFCRRARNLMEMVEGTPPGTT